MSTSDDAARAELEELRQAILDDWIVVTTRTVGVVEAMQATLSWRITKPLRLAKRFQISAQRDGVGVAVDLAAVAVARRLGRG
jgi:hypothetical protein